MNRICWQPIVSHMHRWAEQGLAAATYQIWMPQSRKHGDLQAPAEHQASFILQRDLSQHRQILS